jgi:hypothetical protein
MALWRCPNIGNCTKADLGLPVEIPASEHEPKCAECNSPLVPVNRKKSVLPKWIVLTLIIVVVLCGVTFMLMPSSKPTPPTPSAVAESDMVVAIDGGIFLNALMVHILKWLSETSASSPYHDSFQFGMWGFRPVDANGKQQKDLMNYTPALANEKTFGNLSVVDGPNPDAMTGQVSISYDLFGDLKQVLDSINWNSTTNRTLIVISATSGFVKTDPQNSLKLDENDISQQAEQKNVKIYSIYVNIPIVALDQDRDTVRQQLKALCVGDASGRYFEVSTSQKDASGVRKLTGYEADVRAVFAKILNQKNN